MPFNEGNQYQFSNKTVMDFFENSDSKNCPITSCSLKQPDCNQSYVFGISVDSRAPYGIFAITDFPDGWIDPLCLICENKDEIVSVQIEVDQLSCSQSGNCP